MTLNVEPTTTIEQLMRLIEEKESCPAPFQRLLYCCAALDIDSTVQKSKITAEATLHLTGRLCPQVWVQWQGAWLRSKEYTGCFHNFWGELTAKNLCKRPYASIDSCTAEARVVATLENLTVYHLLKVVAAFLLLEPHEISLSVFGQHTTLQRSTLLTSVDGCAFVCSLCVDSG